MLIDTHTHLQSQEYDADRDQLIADGLSCDLWMINIGTDLTTSQEAITLSEKYEEGVYATVGVHPDYIFSRDYSKTALETLIQHSTKVVALGETGLDFYRPENRSVKEIYAKQSQVFLDHIALAKKHNLALVVHARGSVSDPYGVYDMIYDILAQEKPERVVIHCFGGTLEQAKKFAELNCYLGITGVVTFKKSETLQSIVRQIPLQNLVIETDSPYLTPEPFRGKRNQSSYVSYVAQKIADLRNETFETIAKETTANARRLYII